MTATATSISNHHHNERIGLAGERRRQVLDWIVKHGPATRMMVAVGTGLPINTICSSVFSLRTANLIHELPEPRPCRITGRIVLWMAEGPAPGQLSLPGIGDAA